MKEELMELMELTGLQLKDRKVKGELMELMELMALRSWGLAG
mgnify:CR=1 FL=1